MHKGEVDLTDECDDDDVQQICAIQASCTALPRELCGRTVTVQQEEVQVTRDRSTTPASSTFTALSSTEIAELQRKDADIGKFLVFYRAGERPKCCAPGVMRLVRQRGKMIEENGVLYRKVCTPQGGEVKQLVLPRVLKPQLLEAVHDRMGHQGRQNHQPRLESLLLASHAS